MKKLLGLLLILLVVTGCKNQLKCTQTIEEEDYKFEQKIVLNVGKDDKIKNVDSNYTMIFKDEASAKQYYNTLTALTKSYDIEQKKNKLTIKDSQDYSQYNKSKNEIKQELEKNGYNCK